MTCLICSQQKCASEECESLASEYRIALSDEWLTCLVEWKIRRRLAESDGVAFDEPEPVEAEFSRLQAIVDLG